MFWQALSMDLIGAPEFLAGVYAAEWFQRQLPDWKRSPAAVALAVAVFGATGVVGTLLRTALFGAPGPGFISFGFGMALVIPMRP